MTLDRDEGNRPQTRLENLAGLKPVFAKGQKVAKGKYVTAGNASQLSDGAAALVLMERAEAERRGLEPLGVYRGLAVAGCAPDRMGIGPVYAVPKLLKRHGFSIDDIDLWEFNEAFASQVLYCHDRLGVPNEKLNVSGGAISIGHPYDMSGARMTGHILHEGRRRGPVRDLLSDPPSLPPDDVRRPVRARRDADLRAAPTRRRTAHRARPKPGVGDRAHPHGRRITSASMQLLGRRRHGRRAKNKGRGEQT